MKMFNNLPDLFYLGFYHPRYIYNEDYYEDNEYFNKYSNTILELKDKKYDAINFFLKKFKHFLIDEDLTITTVPPSISSNPSSGIRELAKQLVNLYSNFADAVFCLERFQDSDGNRTLDNHLRTIKVNNPSVIKDKKVILMDDVLTTGSSIQACKKLLIKSGAKEVKIIVLGKTMRNIEDAHDLIDQKIDEYLYYTVAELYREHSFSIQGYNEERYLAEKESDSEHTAVDEWANEQHSYLDADDDEHDDLEEEIYSRHQQIYGIYNKNLTEILRKERNEYSDFENKQEIENENCRYIADQSHQVLDGSTCFSVDNFNSFISYFGDWE